MITQNGTADSPTGLSRKFAEKLLDTLTHDLLCGSLAELFYWCFRQHLRLLLWTRGNGNHFINRAIYVIRVEPNIAALWNILLHSRPTTPIDRYLTGKISVAYLLRIVPILISVLWTNVEKSPVLDHPAQFVIPLTLTAFYTRVGKIISSRYQKLFITTPFEQSRHEGTAHRHSIVIRKRGKPLYL